MGSLNRPSYGIHHSKPSWVQALSRRPQGMVIAGFCTAFTVLAYIPVVWRESRQGLPYTMSPEYEAAQRAYQRYHNMNPIFGISSKTARAADDPQ